LAKEMHALLRNIRSIERDIADEGVLRWTHPDIRNEEKMADLKEKLEGQRKALVHTDLQVTKVLERLRAHQGRRYSKPTSLETVVEEM